MTREKKRIMWQNDYTREARAFSKISFPADSTYILENMLFAFPIPARVVNTGSPNFFDTIITHHYRHIHLFTIFMFTACSLPPSSIHPKVPSLTFAKLTTSPTMIGLSTFLKHPRCHLPTMRSKHVRPRDRRYPRPFDGSNRECK